MLTQFYVLRLRNSNRYIQSFEYSGKFPDLEITAFTTNERHIVCPRLTELEVETIATALWKGCHQKVDAINIDLLN